MNIDAVSYSHSDTMYVVFMDGLSNSDLSFPGSCAKVIAQLGRYIDIKICTPVGLCPLFQLYIPYTPRSVTVKLNDCALWLIISKQSYRAGRPLVTSWKTVNFPRLVLAL